MQRRHAAASLRFSPTPGRMQSWGVHIIGPDAGTMISGTVVATEFGGSSEDLARTAHAHPTLPASVKEAALVLQGLAMHI